MTPTTLTGSRVFDGKLVKNLEESIKSNDLPAVRWILESAALAPRGLSLLGTLYNSVFAQDPFTLAVLSGPVEMVKVIVDTRSLGGPSRQGALNLPHPDLHATVQGTTHLHLLAKKGRHDQVRIFEYLVGEGCDIDINARNAYGETALLNAVAAITPGDQGSLDLVLAMLQRGADPTIPDRWLTTPIALLLNRLKSMEFQDRLKVDAILELFRAVCPEEVLEYVLSESWPGRQP